MPLPRCAGCSSPAVSWASPRGRTPTTGGHGRVRCSADLPVARRPSARPFDEAEDLEALIRGAGSTAVRTTLEHHEVVFGDEAEWWEWKWSYSVRGVLEQVDEEARKAFRDAAFAAMQPLRGVGGFPMLLTAAFTFGEKT